MNREEVRNSLLEISKNNKDILIEIPTGFGKTKYALDVVHNIFKDRRVTILILVPRNVLKEEWRKEIKKWYGNKDNILYLFSTYKSIDKYAGHWDCVIFDEAHHLSERSRDIVYNSYFIDRSILLSATIPEKLKNNIKLLFNNLYCYKIDMKEAIESEVLPDPKVLLIPLKLDDTLATEVIVKNPKGKDPAISTTWNRRWPAMKQKEYKVFISCTPKQYLQDLDSQIDWWKTRYMHGRNDIFKNKWLRLCSNRLKWLSESKNDDVKSILRLIDDQRTLTFCNNIEQTKYLGDNYINSKNKLSKNILKDFNENTINHITCCNMLNEGMNLTNCRVGIYANLNSSETIIKQRLGRILRHKSPIIIIPYYEETRDSELVRKMLVDYTPSLVKKITNLNQFKNEFYTK